MKKETLFGEMNTSDGRKLRASILFASLSIGGMLYGAAFDVATDEKEPDIILGEAYSPAVIVQESTNQQIEMAKSQGKADQKADIDFYTMGFVVGMAVGAVAAKKSLEM